MASDTATLALHGDVSLEAFADAIAHFHSLIAALSLEASATDVEWEVDALEYSSAITTVRGIPRNGSTQEHVERVVRSYLEVGRALEHGTTVPYPKRVSTPAQGITELLAWRRVEAIRFETAEADAIVRYRPRVEVPEPEALEPTSAYGAVTGRVQTLTSRIQLRFTLYDHIHDRAVSCYLAEGRESMMRQMWDRVATVEGVVTRDPISGRPLTVRNVANITPLHEAEPWEYERAKGALPYKEGDLSPEEAIRRLRDAG